MQIDFTGLRELNEQPKQAPKIDFKDTLTDNPTKDTNNDIKPLQALNTKSRNEDRRPVYAKGLEDKIKMLEFKEAYFDYRLGQYDKAVDIRVKINKGLRDNHPLDEVLLLAIEHISNTSGDVAMYNQAKKYIARRKADN